MNTDVKSFFVEEDVSIKSAMIKMKNIGEKVLFVIDAQSRLLGSLSDGDIRKKIVDAGGIGGNIGEIYNKDPKFVSEIYDVEEVKELMIQLRITAVPVVNDKNEIIEVLTWEHVFDGKVKKEKVKIDFPVVIMAGGKGSRLDPFTHILPKPLIPINNRPVIEIIMDSFADFGINKFYLSVNHKAKMIKSYFEEMNDRYEIQYIEEDKPLGTAGSLKMLPRSEKPYLVTNCDTVIDCDYNDVLNFHNEKGFDITIVVSMQHHVIPYGVCEIENGGYLSCIKEKPGHDIMVNTGMYVINDKAFELIPKDEFYNVTELIEDAQKNGLKVGVFPLDEKSWIDIGQWEEYQKAVKKLSLNT